METEEKITKNDIKNRIEQNVKNSDILSGLEHIKDIENPTNEKVEKEWERGARGE